MTFDEIHLRDVQGLFGGRDVSLRADGSYSGRVVDPDGERRFSGTLSPEEVARIERVLSEVDFPALEIPDRYGVPDEARPTIELVRGGERVEKAKWAGQVQMDFDRVYGALKRLAGVP